MEDYELYEMINGNATADEIGDYMWFNCRKFYNGKYFTVDEKRLYPIYEDGVLTGWEFD